MLIKDFKFKSATGVCTITANAFVPDDNNVRGVLVMHHGMAEHNERYHGFFEYLTSNGIAVFMHDMANHGKSNQNADETGYFGDKDGYKGLIKDMKSVYDIAKKEYPDKKIVICGHSMGSFIARCFTAQYAKENFVGAIYIGTGGKNPVAKMGVAVTDMVSSVKGAKYKSKLIDKITFGSYNKGTEGRTGFDWLTKDTAIVDEYIADPMCGFLFSAAGMRDLVNLNIMANSSEWYEKVRKDLPIFVIAGDRDPVGAYGKGFKEINDKLISSGHTDVKMKLYENDRHEILNELDKETVYADVLAFIDRVIS